MHDTRALYRKYRSKTLSEVIGQPQVTNILSKSLAAGQISHAYLLTGPRGVGKTSVARILAHEINGLPYTDESSHLDIIEIDAASNNGVDDVRELRDKSQIAPISASKKVYIIDEVHMLSKAAFNALLKTLEEPPQHVVFILATTDLHKVPATISSRTQHFSFHSISLDDLRTHLADIAQSEGIKIDDGALEIIARRGDGSFRDSISTLDQLSIFANEKDGITAELVENVLGLPSTKLVKDLLKTVESHDVPGVIAILDALEGQGVSTTILTSQLIDTLRTSLGSNARRVKLLDALLDVGSSPQPAIKLLTTLVTFARPKTAAAMATTARPVPNVIQAPVIIVEKQSDTHEPDSKAQPVQQPKPKIPTPKTKPATDPAPKTTIQAAPIRDFNWGDLLAHTTEHHIGLSGILRGCDYQLDGTSLTLYTGKPFKKTRLDGTKYLAELSESFAVLGFSNLTITTVGKPKPPTDTKLAEIADMMGGGVEVNIEGEL